MYFKKLTETAILPTRATAGAAGFDLYADEAYRLDRGERHLVRTGIAVMIPEGREGQIRPRSGLSHKFGITVVNTPGTIDPDYRGELMVNLWNTGSYDLARPSADRYGSFVINAGDRIAQLVVSYCSTPPAHEWWGTDEEWNNTERGIGGHGSTGR